MLGRRVMILSAILSSLIFLPHNTHAGTTGKITGQVTDEYGTPLPGASITIPAYKRGAIADGSIALGIEIYNLFNQRDTRSVSTGLAYSIDFSPDVWKNYGIEGLPLVSSNNFAHREVNDINNYWDVPRELKFSVRVKW